MPLSVLRKWIVLPGAARGGVYSGRVLVAFGIAADGDPQSDLSAVPDVARWEDLVDQLLSPAAGAMQLALEIRGDRTYPSFDPAGAAPPLRLSSAVTSTGAHALWNAYMRPADEAGSPHWRLIGATLAGEAQPSFLAANPPQQSLSFPGKACIERARAMYLEKAADRRILSDTFRAPLVTAALGGADPLQQAKAFLSATTRPHPQTDRFDAAFAASDNAIVQRKMTFEEALSAAGKIPELLRRLRLCFDFELTPGAALTTGAIRAVVTQPDRPAYENDVAPWTAFEADAALGSFRPADEVPDPSATFSRVLYNGWMDLNAKTGSGAAVFAVDQIDPMSAALTALSAQAAEIRPSAGTVSFEARDDLDVQGLVVTTPPFLAMFSSDGAPVAVPSQRLALDPYTTPLFSLTRGGTIHRVPDDVLRNVPPADLLLYGFATDDVKVIAQSVLAQVGIDTPEVMASKMHGLSSGDPTILYGERAAMLDRRLAKAHAVHSVVRQTLAIAALSDAHRDAQDPFIGFEQGDLTATDLMRGVGVDVLDTAKGTWRPICRRHVTYRVPGVTPLDFDEEHAVDTPPLRVLGSSTPQAAVVDHLLTWPQGNSPVAPSGLGGIANDGGIVREAAPGPDGITTNAKPLGPIPALRFGRRYRFRAAAVDMSGRRIAAGDGTPYASSEFVYRRYEPVAAPVIVLPKPLNNQTEPGEALTTIIFRGHATGSLPSSYEPQRHLLPPRCDGAFAARHGALDGVDSHTAYGSWSRTARYPADAGEKSCIDVANLPFDSEAGSAAALPDPMARAYIVSGVPGAGHPLRLDLYPQAVDAGDHSYSWPNPIPWRIVVSATDDINVPPPEIDLHAENGVGERFAQLRVYLHRSQRATIAIACEITEAQRDLMGIWNDIVSAASSPIDPTTFWNEVRTHGHWLINPAVQLDLVHAVVEPMFAPSTTAEVDRTRAIGEREHAPPHAGSAITRAETVDSARAQLTFERYMPNASVERLECRLHWREWLDLGRKTPEPVIIERSECVFTDTLPPIANGWRTLNFSHAFDSTRAKECALSYTVTSRFGQFVTDDPAMTSTAVDPERVLIRNTTRPKPIAVRSVDLALASDPPFGAPEPRAAATRRVVIRVRFERPAYQSGLNERIAVVLADDVALSLPANGDFKEPAFVSLAGRDPRLTTGTVLPLDRSQAGLFTRPAGADPIVSGVRHHQPTGTVTLIPYEMQWDGGEDCWYIDVAVDGLTSYTPFVKLALLRFQRDSVWDPEPQPENRFNRACSDIVVLAPVPLHPSRTATVERVLTANASLSAHVVVRARPVAPETRFEAQLLVLRTADEGGQPFDEWGPPVRLDADATGSTFAGTVSSDHAGPWKVRVTEIETVSGADREVYFDELDVPERS